MKNLLISFLILLTLIVTVPQVVFATKIFPPLHRLKMEAGRMAKGKNCPRLRKENHPFDWTGLMALAAITKVPTLGQKLPWHIFLHSPLLETIA